MIALIDRFNQVRLDHPGPDIIEIYKHIPEINEIDNRGFLISRPLFSHSSLPKTLDLDIVEVDDFDFKSEFSYFVYVHHNQELWIKHINLLPEKVLDGIRKGKGMLIFDNTLEGQNVERNYFIDPFYKNITDLGLPAEKIVFITNNFIAEKTHNEWFKNQNVYDKKINLITFMWNVYDVKRLIKNRKLPEKVNIQNEIEYKSKNLENMRHFLKVNRTGRIERNLFMLFLQYHNLFDKCLISFPGFKKTVEVKIREFEKYLTEENIENLKSKLPFDIDETDESNHGEAGHGKGFFDADLPFQPIHYKNTFISIVFCAFPFPKNAHHLHSSTFNPMYCGQPIVQLGPYKTLEVMRELGFKTFGKWWDESYDEVKNGWKRLDKVMNVVLDLSKLSNKELLEMYIDMKDVLQHNVDLISNYDGKTNLYDRIFYEKI